MTDPKDTVRDLDADDLQALLNACINEQERRANLERFPQRAAAEAQRYVEDGGDVETLRAALEPVVTLSAEESPTP